MGNKILRFLYNLRHLNSHADDLQKAYSIIEEITSNFEIASSRIEEILSENTQLRNRLEETEAKLEKTKACIEETETKLEKTKILLDQHIIQTQQTLKARLRLPVRVVFLCELPSLWESFNTVISEMQKDSRFEVILVRMWCKKYDANGSYQYTAADFSEISHKFNLEFIESYDQEDDTWLRLEQLVPDYVFYMRPYDYYRNEIYHVNAVSRYTKTCYIPYGMSIIGGEVERFAAPADFCKYLYFYFQDTPLREQFWDAYNDVESILIKDHVVCLGYPRMDRWRKISNSDVRKTQFTMLWLPRWNTSENCCNFFEYKDPLIRLAIENHDSRLIFRPHPLCFQNFLNTGEMTESEIRSLKQLFQDEPNLSIDENADYYNTFLESDVLIADETSLIAEYYATGKPIILCRKETHFSVLMERLSDGIYIADNWNDLCALINILRNGNDPLKAKRLQLIPKELFQMTDPAGLLIKEHIASNHFSGMYQRNV